MVETCIDGGDTLEFGVSLLLVDDAGGSGVGLTFQRVLSPLGLGALSLSSLWIVSGLDVLHFPLQIDFPCPYSCCTPGSLPSMDCITWAPSLPCGCLGLANGGPS